MNATIACSRSFSVFLRGDFMLTRKECIQLLKQDVTPALGCTEPVCVALCLANAAKVLDDKIVSIDVDVQ